MSAGDHGSNPIRRSWNSAGSGRSAGGGVDAGAERVQRGAQLRLERRRLALGGAPQAQRPHERSAGSPWRPAISASRPVPIRR